VGEKTRVDILSINKTWLKGSFVVEKNQKKIRAFEKKNSRQ
jgi:hypothetical protein